jgi:acetyl esterase/lipase
MPLHPRIVELVAAMERADRPKLYELPIDTARTVFGALPHFLGDLGYDVPSRDEIIVGPLGQIPVRIYSPSGVTEGVADRGRPLVVFFHGGGFCIGDLDSHDRECRAIAAQAHCPVIAVDYRMGPEHPYTADAVRPPWIDDAWAAFRWAADHATELGADPGRLVVCGDSAGANISAVIAQLARDEGLPLALQALIYPATDVREEASDLYPSYAEHVDAPFLERPALDYFTANSRAGGDATSPLMSPGLTDDLSGLAPALIVTAEYDPLRDDGEHYAERLRAAGVPVTLTRYAGMPHGFFNLGPLVDDAVSVVVEVASTIAVVHPVADA